MNLSGIADDLGWDVISGGYGASVFTYEDGSRAGISEQHTGNDYDLPSGERRSHTWSVSCIDASGDVIKFSGDVIASENISNDPYLIGKSSVYVSFDQIVVYAYLVDYYRYSIEPAFETDLYFVTVP